MKCENCGAPVLESDWVCMKCGHEVRAHSQTAAPARQSQASARLTGTEHRTSWPARAIFYAIILTPVVALVYFGDASLTQLMMHGDWRLDDGTYIRFPRGTQGNGRLVRYWSFSPQVEKEYDGDHKGHSPSTKLVLTERPYVVPGQKAVLRPGYPPVEGDEVQRDAALAYREKLEKDYQDEANAEQALCYVEFDEVEYKFVFPNTFKVRTAKQGKARWAIPGLFRETAQSGLMVPKVIRTHANFLGGVEGGESYTVVVRPQQLHVTGSKTGTCTPGG